MRKIKFVIPVVILLFGLCLYLYPVLSGRAIGAQMNDDIDQFLQEQVQQENPTEDEGQNEGEAPVMSM